MNQRGFGGFIWRQHVGMIMAILDPKGQPFILTLLRLAKLIIPPAPLPEHQRPTTRQTAGGKEERNGTLKARDKTKQWAALPSSPDPA